MTGSVALDVVIGLVFVYLLYSLLGTLLAEIVATNLQLRARNLKEAINRMLKDQDPGRLQLIKQALRLPKTKALKLFYDHQEIQYLGKSLSSSPAAIKAVSFVKVILDRIREKGTGSTPIEQIQSGLRAMSQADPNDADMNQVLDPKTAQYILSILEDCQNDLEKFKAALEGWFDRTMEQTTEWYKQRIQIILLGIGFFIAWFFNADTFTIVKRLSTDPTARQQMVQLASAYVENQNYERTTFIRTDSAVLKDKDSAAYVAYIQIVNQYDPRMDTLLAIKKELDADIAAANSVLGLGGWLPDSVTLDSTGLVTAPNWVEPRIASRVISSCKGAGTVPVGFWQKVGYLLLLPLYHLPGYFVTALAISMGAPFWFDLLNKLMKLRGNVKGAVSNTNNVTN